MNKLIAIISIGFALCAIASTQTSKEYVDRRDNEVLSHANEYTDDSVRGLAHEDDIPTKVSQLQNDTGYVTGSATNGLVERANSYADEKSRQTLIAAKQYTDNATNGQSKVMSVNGRTGNVVLSSVDVHARPDNWMPSSEDVGAQPTLVSGVNIKTVNGNSLLGSGNIVIRGGVSNSVDGAARPTPKYLHIYEADDSYPDAAQEYYRSRGDGKVDGGCSSVRDGGYLSRNFDFPFDERAEFVVRMSAGPNRFANVGVSQVGTNLTEQMVTSGNPEYSRLYKWLPGATVDGINENGVVCEINVVDTEPPRLLGGDIHPLGAVRWALDNGTSAEMVATSLAARIMWPSGWRQNFHWMVADGRETWIVENGVASNVTAVAAKRVMTNFEILPDTYEGMGKERYDLLLSSACCITNAWYARAYRRETNPPWVSDLAEVIDYTNEIFDAWSSHPKEYFRSQLNGGQPWWQSVHTSVYDLTNRTLRVAVQETDDWYTFAVPVAGGVKQEAVREIVQPMLEPVSNIAASAQTAATDAQQTANVAFSRSYEVVQKRRITNAVQDVLFDITNSEWTVDYGPYVVVTGIDVEYDDDDDYDNPEYGTWKFHFTYHFIGEEGLIFEKDFDFRGHRLSDRFENDQVLIVRTLGYRARYGLATTNDVNAAVAEVADGKRDKTDLDYGGFWKAGDVVLRPNEDYECQPCFESADGAKRLYWQDTWYYAYQVDPLMESYAYDSETGGDMVYDTQATEFWVGPDGSRVRAVFSAKTRLATTNDVASAVSGKLDVAGDGDTMTGDFRIRRHGTISFSPYDDYVFEFNQSGNLSFATSGKVAFLTTSGVDVQYGDLNLVEGSRLLANGVEVISPANPAFSNAVLAVGIDTNILAAVAASTNAVAQIGDFYAAFEGIGITPTEGGMTLAGLLAALVAAVTWLKKNALKRGLTGGVPDDPNVRDFFAKSDGSQTELKNSLLQSAIDARVGVAVGDVNAVLAAALDGSEVA